MTSYRVIIFSIMFYVLFSFKPQLEPFEGVLFANDFSKEGIFEWFYYSVISYCFVAFIGIVGFNRVEKTSDKLIFLALIVDGVINIFRYIVFGYYEPDYLIYLSNSIPLGIIIYSQVHGRIH
jgi:hypothetical protein